MRRAMLFLLLAAANPSAAMASDHLDAPNVIEDPRADIADLYAWMSPNGKKLQLALTIVGPTFSDKLTYEFHLESTKRFGKSGYRTTIFCRFASAAQASCHDRGRIALTGDASGSDGLSSKDGKARLFAGIRDDPFFNNVRGTREAYQVALDAIRAGVVFDSARCPLFTAGTSQAILSRWRQTGGGPPRNFLQGWNASAIVLSVDVDLVSRGGPILAVWAATRSADRQIDRAGRPLTGNVLLGTTDNAEARDAMKLDFNASTPADGRRFAEEIAENLALYDGFDGACGNQALSKRDNRPDRYRELSLILADDRLWVDSRQNRCLRLFAVELAALVRQTKKRRDCGGRTPIVEGAKEFRSLLMDGTYDSLSDGLTQDDGDHSTTTFPFLAAPRARKPAS